MSDLSRREAIRQMKVRFERWLPNLLSHARGRLQKGNTRHVGMEVCRAFIDEFYDEIVGRTGTLGRFLQGELTGGHLPVYVPNQLKRDVGCMVEASTIIELLADKAAAGWRGGLIAQEIVESTVATEETESIIPTDAEGSPDEEAVGEPSQSQRGRRRKRKPAAA